MHSSNGGRTIGHRFGTLTVEGIAPNDQSFTIDWCFSCHTPRSNLVLLLML
jgi:hypothetical protein